MHFPGHNSKDSSSPSPSPSPNNRPSGASEEPPPYDLSNSELAPKPNKQEGSHKKAPPIFKHSTSSLLREGRTGSSSSSASTAATTPTKRNVPYTPSKEQQKYIDSLSNSSSSVNALSTVSSSTQTEYFDVLPSFQMFQSILKRDDNQFSEDLRTLPPVYGDTANSSPTPPSGLSPVSSNSHSTNISTVMESVNTRLAEYELEREHEERGDYLFDEDHDVTTNESEEESTHNQNVAVTQDRYGHSPLDNIDKLHKAPHSPIDIQTFVTKFVPQPNQKNELETRLKEYTSGDMVNGYIIITNTSDKPVNFGLFTVSLEGTIKATERNHDANALEGHKYSKILMKKFLKMYDLNASYGYTDIPNSAGIEYTAFSTDTSDGTQIGLPNERVLEPHQKYKKFFTFRFPDRLLDNSCIHSILPHVLPPPSMGLDRTCFYNRGNTIQLNKALGYGFLNVRGTPLLTRDYSFEDVSVSYTIEAKFIDKKDTKDQVPLSESDINDSNSDADYVISKSTQYFLRFIPDLKEQLQNASRSFHYTPETYEFDGIDGKLFLDYLHLSTWRYIHMQNYQLEKEIDDRLAKEELSIEDIKHKNLIVSNSESTSLTLERILSKQHSFEESRKQRESDYNEQIHYEDLKMIGSKTSFEIYGKKKKMILSSLIKIGESRIYVKVPNKVIPYTSPKLLMKYNMGIEDDKSNTISPVVSRGNLTPTKTENSLRPIPSLTRVSSHISGIYNRSESDIISSLDISLIFDPVENSAKPPQISFVETNVVFWNYYTEYPLPFELGYDFFYANPDEKSNKAQDSIEFTKNNLQELKDQVSNYIHFLKTNQVFVSKNNYLYLKSIKNLGVKKDTIKDYYKTINANTHAELLNSESSWKANQLPNKKMQWVKNLTIPLIPINKNNINLLPSFQSCLVGRLYCLQVVVKYKGSGSDQNEFADNMVKVDVPILVG
ncbi:ubiquitination pathway protein [Scheffersomyces xylosifermentans]|uniref:ubiquitination pathway protein n=1 Tax=Scheffersomyces xylosifermentans TaxID=1304137 RepID=UPI00315D92B3